LSICLGSTNRTDANRNFVFCPVPAGSYEVVAAAVNGAGMGYGATVITGVQPTSPGNTYENRRPSGMIP
jgi:hypothetical protein